MINIQGLRVLSLFGGIETGLLALQELEIPIAEYHTYEILPAAIKVSKKNFPFIVYHGDVRDADFNEYKGFDLILGGSPCQNRSRIRKETPEIHSGLQGDKSSLFWCYAKAIEIVKPKWFLLENVVSELPEDDDTITRTLGVKPVLINSNVFSAQDRERLYWTNIPLSHPPLSCPTVIKDIMDFDVPEKYYYNKDFIFNGEDKKIIATLKINTTEMCQRVYNPNFKCGTLTCITGGYQEKKVWDNGRIRKMTEQEYEKLQTLPAGFTDGCGLSYTARCSLCGNGWNKDTIKFILKGLKND